MKKSMLVAICLVGIPLVGFGNVVITALAQNGGVALLFNPFTGVVYTTALFFGGQATLSTSMLDILDKYAVTMTYSSGETWRSDVYWDAGSSQLSGYKTYIGEDDAVTVLTGEITSRSFVAAAGARSVSITMVANGDLGIYNNDNNELDANILLYRPSASVEDIGASASITKVWDPSTLAEPYGFSTEAWDYGYELITLTHNGSFYAEYLGKDLGNGSFELSFAAAIDPGGSSYNTGSVVSNPDGSVTFISYAFSSTDPLASQTPYYVMMEAAWMYDDDGNYSVIPDDAGLVLTHPDYYTLTSPDPVVISLKPVSSNVVEMVFSCADSSTSYPLISTNLVDGSWEQVGHATNSVGPFTITNLSYSAALGSDRVIYLEAPASVAFFGIGQ